MGLSAVDLLPRRLLLSGWLLLLSGCCETGSCVVHEAEEAPALFAVVDLTDDFADFQRNHADLPDAAKLVAFKATFDALFPGFYDSRRISWLTDEQYDDAILRALNEFPEWQDRFESRAARFAAELNPAVDSFRRFFPGLEPIGPIFVLYSLREFDGAVRNIRGKRYLVFGIDVMELVHDFRDETPFFHHELFHVYHGQYFAGCDNLWCSLWSEGLAVAAAHTLNTGASDSQLLLTSPRPLRAAVDANLAEAVCAVRSLLQSSAGKDYSAVFGNAQLNDQLPPRFGYYLGYLVVNDAMGTRRLKELAELSVRDALPVVVDSLENLASCSE